MSEVRGPIGCDSHLDGDAVLSAMGRPDSRLADRTDRAG
jgi:hypothetical protein